MTISSKITPGISTARRIFFLGRGVHFPVALEGALKMREVLLHPRGGLPGRRDETRACGNPKCSMATFVPFGRRTKPHAFRFTHEPFGTRRSIG